MNRSCQLKRYFKAILFVLILSTIANCQAQTKPVIADKQQLVELTADRMMKRFYETLQFETVWQEFYVTDKALRDLEVEAITFSLVRYGADALSQMRIRKEARERAYVAQHDFWATLSAALFTGGNVPRSGDYGRTYQSITQRPKPYANSSELDKDFTMVMNHLSDANRKLVVVGNVGSSSYKERLSKFHETHPTNPERIRDVFAPAGLRRNSPIYVVQREMFHIYMIEEKGEFRILTILNRQRG